MLIPSRSSAHTVHRKQEEEELLCAKVGERNSKTRRKGSNPHRLPKVHCKLARFRFILEPFPHRKTMKLQHCLIEGGGGFFIVECRRYTTSKQNQEKVGGLV